MSTQASWRSAAAVRTALVTALASATALTGYGLFADGTAATDEATDTTVNANPATESAPKPRPQVASFTTADVGSCLTWDVDGDGVISNFEQADCAQEHRFEVSAREDLSAYPTAEFGPDAEIPGTARQAQLREELCRTPTLRYLDGRFDPSGKYSIAPILPPAPAWENGDRTMLCGLQSTDSRGAPQLTQGKVSERDQARVYSAQSCLRIEDSQTLTEVACAEPHHMEVTSTVNLRENFPDGYPAENAQDEFLADVCTRAAEDYLGGEENLYQSTLQPYWGAISEDSWRNGSYSVNCTLVHARDGGGFSTIEGTAREGRGALTIDGGPPEERPERNPRR